MIAAGDALSHLMVRNAISSMSDEFGQECQVPYETDLKDSPLPPIPRRTTYEEGNDRPDPQIHGRPRLG